LSLLRDVVARCNAANVHVTLCGEAAGRPLEAMALVGLGLRDISMAAGAIGAVKMMVRSLDVGALQECMAPLFQSTEHSVRPVLEEFARNHGVAI
jgi:phosphotransferase system enzyme I (PtsP)